MSEEEHAPIIKSLWESYYHRFHPEVPKTCNQYIESKKVFYVGASEILLLIKKMAEMPDLSEKDAAHIIDSIGHEIAEYLRAQVKKDRYH